MDGARKREQESWVRYTLGRQTRGKGLLIAGSQ